MNVLVTGGAGFIGSHFCRLAADERPEWQITVLDLLTYAANPENLAGVPHEFVRGDIVDRKLVADLFYLRRFDAVVHCAAESHVDRSITQPTDFCRTNVEGTIVLLMAAQKYGARHVQVSTDEVYGHLAMDDPPFTEATRLAPRSPYSASKAAADHMALAFHATHGTDVVITRCGNNFGTHQHPEKLFPLCITSALRSLPIPLHGDGSNVRDWIHVADHCRGLLAVLEGAAAGEVYNIGARSERTNRSVVYAVLDATGADRALCQSVADRPGNDRRYAVDASKAQALGWTPTHDMDGALPDIVEWYRANPAWWAAAAAEAHTLAWRRVREWKRAA